MGGGGGREGGVGLWVGCKTEALCVIKIFAVLCQQRLKRVYATCSYREKLFAFKLRVYRLVI